MLIEPNFIKLVVEDPLVLNRRATVISSLEALSQSFNAGTTPVETTSTYKKFANQSFPLTESFEATLWKSSNAEEGPLMATVRSVETGSKCYPFHIEVPFLERFIALADRELSQILASPGSSEILKAISLKKEVRLVCSTKEFTPKIDLRLYTRSDFEKPFATSSYGFCLLGFNQLSSFRRNLPNLLLGIENQRNFQTLKKRLAEDLVNRFEIYVTALEIPEIIHNRGKLFKKLLLNFYS